MRIAVDASRVVGARQTGTERYARELCGGFGNGQDQHDWILYSRAPLSQDVTGRARNRVISRSRLWTHLGLSEAMAIDRPDALFVPAHVIPAIHPAGSVVTIHDLGYLRYRLAYSASAWVHLALSTIWSATVARAIVCDSYATETDLVRHIPAALGKTSVAHLGVGASFHPATNANILKLGLGRDYLLALGTIQPRKNLRRLLRAYHAVSTDRAFPKLVIAGSPANDSAPIDRLISELALGDRVKLMGYAAPEDLAALYSGALAFVFPSLYEGFGLPPLEAMACGAPVIAGDNSSMPEIIGDAGLLVDASSTESLGAAIRRVVDEPVLRQTLIARGFPRAASFTWASTVSRVRRVIESTSDRA